MAMTDNKQLLDKNDENVDRMTTGQPYTRLTGTSIGAGLATEENGPTIALQPDAPPDRGMSNRLAQAAIGAVVGAVVGTVAGALANKKTVRSINHSFKGVGDAVKGATEGVKHTVKRAGDALQGTTEGVASGFNHTVEVAGEAFQGTQEDVNHTVVGAREAFQGIDEDVNQTVVGAGEQVQHTLDDAKPSEHQSFKLYQERLLADKKQVKTAQISIGKHVETQTAHISVPLKKERLVIERVPPVNAGTPVVSGEANFHEGEIARIEVYEEKAHVQKQAFVREEVSIRKEVEYDTFEVKDTIRREELDLDAQGRNVIDKTKT